MKDKAARRITAWFMAFVVLFLCMPSFDALADERCYWVRRIEGDVTIGDYLTKNLGMDRVTRQSVILTIRNNWTKGLEYNRSAYAITHEDAASCVNYGTEQYTGRVRKGYGYNCTGFVASVLYYANGGTKDGALANMNQLYDPLKPRSGSFTDGTGWYYFLEGNEAEGIPKTLLFDLGEVKDPDAIRTALAKADREGKLREGYILFFWPSTGWDCHFGIYAGKGGDGSYEMYHAAGRGNHNGVRLESSIDRSAVTCEGASYMYVLPLPEQKPGLQEIDGKTYFFCRDGRMARYVLFGMYYFDGDGAMIDIRRIGQETH